ncbi:MAG: calcium-binding protein, partial [Alphaproteobacteria bacterium]
MFIGGAANGYNEAQILYDDNLKAFTRQATKDIYDAAYQRLQELIQSDGGTRIGTVKISTKDADISISNQPGKTTIAFSNLSSNHLADADGVLSGLNSSIKHFNNTVDNLTYGSSKHSINVVTSDQKVYNVSDGDAVDIAKQLGGTINSQDVKVMGSADASKYSLIKDGATIHANNTDYALTHVVDSVYGAANEAAKFISDQVGIGTQWFTGVDTQTLISTWLAGNIEGLIDGDISAQQAVINLATMAGKQWLAREGIQLINSETDATNVLSQAFQERFDLAPEIAGDYAASITGAVTNMAVEFVFSGFDKQQAINAGAGYLASQVATTYIKAQGFAPTTGISAAGSAAAATAIVGIINSRGYDRGDWAMLGVQVGVAAGSAAAGIAIAAAANAAATGQAIGAAIAKAFLNASLSTGNPVVIVASAIVAFVASKIVSSVYKGASFGEGEFRSVEQVLNSVYQVQTITVNGQQVPALVAVNSNGSTVIAAGTGIGYVLGGVGADVLVGAAGMQTIVGGGGADYIEGRAGDDVLIGGDGNDHLNGGDGDDILQGDAGEDLIFGEEGKDTVIAGVGDDFVHLGSGNDIVTGGDGNDYILTSGGDDVVTGDAGNDTIDGGYGDDKISGGTGDDLILGNIGNDAIDGEDGRDTIFGGEGNDQIHGGDRKDFIDGRAGIELLYGDNGNDLIVGGAGDDFADGGLGNDNILGGAGNDILLGGMDDDYLSGEAGDDTLSGGFGNDIVIGGVGADIMDGGDGNDVFVVSSDVNDRNNIITDEGAAGETDTLLLSWLSQTDANNGLTLQKSGNNLVVSYDNRVLATVNDQFVAGKGIERIELASGNAINLAGVTYNAQSNLGSFTIANALTTAVAGAVAAQEEFVRQNMQSQGLYWNDTFLNKLSQLAYDEQLGDQTTYTYYDGNQVGTFKKARSKWGDYYTVFYLS